jgi:hypothetical protein
MRGNLETYRLQKEQKIQFNRNISTFDMEASHKKKLEMKLETGKNGIQEASINMILVTKPRGDKNSKS